MYGLSCELEEKREKSELERKNLRRQQRQMARSAIEEYKKRKARQPKSTGTGVLFIKIFDDLPCK